MSRKTQRLLRKLFPYFCVLVIGIMIVLGVALFAYPKEKDPAETEAASTDAPSSEDLTVIEESTTPSETEPELPTVSALDAVNVDSLIDRYYEAKINSNAEELNNIVDSETEYSDGDLAYEPEQFIEKYDNFKTYIIPGITDEYFVVYVRYDIFFNGIKTGAPALNHFIVQKDADGFYYIYDKAISGEFQTYLEETENSETVQDLKKQVDDELAAACEADIDLKYLIELLNGPAETEAPETPAETEAPAESETAGEEAPADDAAPADAAAPLGAEAPAEP